ncbi:AAA family ATPase [Acidianus brierleyi]|uniref:ATPase n=1 Tax=Acidianus brierleyi TaxID=41673 RepID=A0A2U9IDI3_9CREN|nr:ATP-binding protein [Acidianus brierleyi]AWR94004.1 AAA family ATPase [Acidianus brierleyi]
MIFDERPKDNRRDLFDREKELEKIENNIIAKKPLLLLVGVRRIGKTSVLQTALNEINETSLIIDCRKLKENYGRRDLYSLFSQSLTSRLDKLKDILRKINGVSIFGNYVELKWSGKDYISIADLLDHLNERRIIIAIDEAQKLRGPLSKEVKDAIAHAYDYDKNITFILTGSEVGLLYDFLGVNDVESPLYGRYYNEIELERFDKEKSIEMLKKGFEELSFSIKDDIINSIVNEFDGIPGWLVFAGLQYFNKRDFNEIKETAISIALNEIEKLTGKSPASRRYKTVMKCIAKGNESWSKVKECLELEEKSTISSSILSNILGNLEKMSLIKDYKFLDPIYKEASIRIKP